MTSTVFQSHQDDGWMIMEGCVQWNLIYGWKDFHLWGSAITSCTFKQVS